MTPWSTTGNHRIHKVKEKERFRCWCLGERFCLQTVTSMEFLSMGIICIPSWGINREKSSRAATMVSTYNTLEKQHTQTQRASTQPVPNFITQHSATSDKRRKAMKVVGITILRTGASLPDPIPLSMACDLSSYGFFQRQVSRETACIAGGRWGWITWGTDFVQCADFGSLLDRGRGGELAEFSVFDRGLVWRMLPSGLDDPMSFSTH